MSRKYKRIMYEDRKSIEKLREEGLDIKRIADVLGVHRDTIYKEFKRCGMTLGTYSAEEAQRLL